VLSFVLEAACRSASVQRATGTLAVVIQSSQQPMHAIRAAAAIALACAMLAALAATPSRAFAGAATEPIELDAGSVRVRAARVAEDLVWPWDLAFLPNGNGLLVTEAPGRLRIVRDGVLVAEPVWIAPSPESSDALHGVVLHPRFVENGFVYLSYVKEGFRGMTLAVARGRLEADRLVDVRDVFVANAWAKGLHNTAGRMAFGPDGHLYLSVGDRDRLWQTDDASSRMRAQRLDNHVGKIVRLTDAGGVPPDNPFVGRRGTLPEVFAYGFRNGYGLAFHPRTGALWQADIGPLGGDELNVLERGGNYGWPLVSAGTHYSTNAVRHGAIPPDALPPIVSWVPAITPSSLLFYTGERFPSWRGSLFVSALSGQHVQRIELTDDGRIRAHESLLTELGVRFRVVAQGPDGFLYVATETTYGSGKPDGAILRIEPAPPAPGSGGG
jgi:glucose/arabinose dehydrogenase